MHFQIKGIDRLTGQAVGDFTVQAESERSAVDLAAARGVMVEKITQLKDARREAKGTQPSESGFAEVWVAADTESVNASTPKLARAPVHRHSALGPSYTLLTVASGVYLILGAILAGIGLTLLLEPPVDGPRALGIWLLLASLPLFAIAALLHAVRDIAINSWHCRVSLEEIAKQR